MRVVVLGAAGAVGRKVVLGLKDRGYQVAGIDSRAWPGAPVECHAVDVRKRAAEEVFRRTRPHAVVHIAALSSLSPVGDEQQPSHLAATRAVCEYASSYGVEHLVFVGRHTFYGASPDLPLFHTPDEPPLALNLFPQLADLVAADLYAGTAVLRSPALATTVLRVCYTFGASGHGALATFLLAKRVPLAFGFDPLCQFLHEDDAARAIVVAVEKRPLGIFNVAGPQPLPLSRVVDQVGRRHVVLPESILALLLGRFGLPELPAGALSHLKYPVLVDAKAFRDQTGFVHRHDELETIRSFREALPPRR